MNNVKIENICIYEKQKQQKTVKRQMDTRGTRKIAKKAREQKAEEKKNATGTRKADFISPRNAPKPQYGENGE